MKKNRTTAPRDGAATVGNLSAAWPFPTGRSAETFQQEQRDDDSMAAPAGDRVQVQHLRLYTDPTQNQAQLLAVEQLLESPFNSRTNYDLEALNALADTIRGVGVIEPILVRPVDLQGATITRGAEALPAFEIIFGHRRFRAAKIAGEASLPAFVRDLTTGQAMQLQAIENVQREDLGPVEEAKAYQQYLVAHGVSKDQLAQEMGLSRSHVYARLKLLQATSAVHDALRAGKIDTEVALYIARLHSPKIQDKALAALASQHHDIEDGGKRSVRRIREFLREKFALDLKDAIFDTKDAQLLANADACTACTKRTGNAPEYQDLANAREDSWGHRTTKGEPNLCTDPECWEAKKKQHLANEAGKLEAKGKTVIGGNKARQLVSAQGEVKGGYVPLKQVKEALAKAAKAGKGKGADGPQVQTVVIQDPRGGKTIEAVKVADLQAAGVKVKEPATRNDRGNYEEQRRHQEEERAKNEQKAAEATRFNQALLGAVRLAAAGSPLSTVALQLVVAAALRGVAYEERGVIAQLHDCKSVEQLQKKVGQLPVDRLTTLLLSTMWSCGRTT
jgi:ParB/RepB/Spo0J family partition protein